MRIKYDQDAYHENDARLRGQAEEPLKKSMYRDELVRLQTELVKLQESVIKKRKKVLIIFEGRDAAGKGCVIRAIARHLNPRYCHICALPKPTEREKSQWYFQRYVQHLPSAGEIVLFDRSWYNRAGVEKVMGFCGKKEYENFLKACPVFESLVIEGDVQLIKYWFSVSNTEQEKRFQARQDNRNKRWKLSSIDLESRNRWEDYSRAKDEMLKHTDTELSPWFIVPSDDKKRAKLNCITHILETINYDDISLKALELPPRSDASSYRRPPMMKHNFIPKIY